MALAGRSIRRGAPGLRWLAVAVAVTLLVLLIDASLHSSSPGPGEQLAAGAWVDRVLPVVSSSTAEGRVIQSIWANGLKMPAGSVAGEIDQVSGQARNNYEAVANLHPPRNLEGAAGLLEAALLARSVAASDLQKALTRTLGSAGRAPSDPAVAGTPTSSTTSVPPVGSPPASQVASVTRAGSEIGVGDQAYQLFLQTVPRSIGVRMPQSSWGADPATYTPQAVAVFLTSLQSSVTTSPVHQVRIYAISLTPSPVSANGSVQILPDASSVDATIVVADTGNQPEPNLTVTASISPAGSGTSSVRDFVSLEPGQAYTISKLGSLDPPKGTTVTLTVTVTAPTGSTTPPATSGLAFSMPGPTSPATTTVPGAATTVPGG